MSELVAINQEVGIKVSPEETLEFASRAASALKQVISLKPKPVILNGEQYLEMEDWELCGQFYGYTVKTGDAIPVEVDGVKGAKAHADLIDLKTGMYLGGAEAYCMRDEEHWNTRPKYEWRGEGDNRKRVKVGDEVVPWFQLASMAQTRAGAKAFRNRLAWVVVLAGYKPTPAEEMTESTVSLAVQERRTVDPSEHYCEVHKVNFFKTKKMRGYAHPIKDEKGEDTGQWCNETSESPRRVEDDVEDDVKPDVEDIDEPIMEMEDIPEGIPPIPDFSKTKGRAAKVQALNDYRNALGVTIDEAGVLLSGGLRGWLDAGNTIKDAAIVFQRYRAKEWLDSVIASKSV